MRSKFAATVAAVVLLPLFFIWAGVTIWETVGATWCGEECTSFAVSGTLVAFVTAAIGGAAAGFWAWLRFPALQALSSRVLGLANAIALLPVLFIAIPIRAVLADHYFPYVISLRFGYTGIFLSSALLSLIIAGVVVLVAVRWSNLTTRWSGP